jgi:hypothetical protein
MGCKYALVRLGVEEDLLAPAIAVRKIELTMCHGVAHVVDE